MEIVLGIDPGQVRLGLGLVKADKITLEFVADGMISHPLNSKLTFNEYIDEGIGLYCDEFAKLLGILKPTLIVSEFVPPGRLGSSSESVIAALTTCKVVAYQFGIPWKGMAASTIKKHITGDGRASKAKVKNAVIARFPIMGERHAALKKEQKALGEKAVGLPPDVFDGVAIAIIGAEILVQGKHV